MNKKTFVPLMVLAILILLSACSENQHNKITVRSLADTVGFAHLDWQMDSLMARIERYNSYNPESGQYSFVGAPKVVISPHDDYTYVGGLYPAALRNIKAKTIILFGVAHKARLLNLENQVIFDSYDYWKGPFGTVKVSKIRNEIIRQLPDQCYQVNDSMQTMEHSVEAIVPFLQYDNRNVQIVSILVPYMSYGRMSEIAIPLAKAIKKETVNRGMKWGTDFTFVISTDAVHYGDDGWGDSNFSFYGTDSAGYEKAVMHEHEIMETLSGVLNTDNIEAFCRYTVDESDYHKYKWTWCGRYSVPLGLLTAYELNQQMGSKPLTGKIIGYANSIDHPAIKVHDLGMGTTAPANTHHWVGYAAIGYQ